MKEMAGTLDSCPLNRGVRLIGVSVKRGSTVVKKKTSGRKIYTQQSNRLPGLLYICNIRRERPGTRVQAMKLLK